MAKRIIKDWRLQIFGSGYMGFATDICLLKYINRQSAYMVYKFLIWTMGKGQVKCRWSVKHIADYLGINKSTVSDATHHLEEIGLIEIRVTQDGERCRNTYYYRSFTPELQENIDSSLERTKSFAGTVLSSSLRPSETVVKKNVNKINLASSFRDKNSEHQEIQQREIQQFPLTPDELDAHYEKIKEELL